MKSGLRVWMDDSDAAVDTLYAECSLRLTPCQATVRLQPPGHQAHRTAKTQSWYIVTTCCVRYFVTIENMLTDRESTSQISACGECKS